MTRPIATPPALPDEPPFWRALDPEERGLYGVVTAVDQLAEMNGWTPARLLITTLEGERRTVVGYVRKGLALWTFQVGQRRMASLLHVASSTAVAHFLDDDQAFFAADMVRTLAPWDRIHDAEIVAFAPAVAQHLQSMGFRIKPIRVRATVVQVLIRNTPSSRPGGQS